MNSEFHRTYRCAICMKIPTRSALSPDCMHRCCKECFEEYLRRGQKHECPTCRKPIGHRRILRQDPLYDGLLKLVNDQMQGN